VRNLQAKSEAAKPVVQDITPPVPSDLAEKAHQLTMETGGSTLDLAGNAPTKGIAYAPSKATEFSIEQEKYTPALYDQYVQAHMDELSQPGKHIGTWIDNGKVYFDVIEVGDKTPATLEKAQNAEQLGVFDLGTHETIPLGTMENGVYTKLNGTTSNIDNLDSGKNPSANSDGGKIGVSEVPNDVSKVAGSGNDNGEEAPKYFRKRH
jgi:hypothetical protein